MTVSVPVGFAVAFAVVFIITGLLVAWAERQERRAARSKLRSAQAAYAQGELGCALRLLDGAFYVPSSSRYRAEDAATALEAMRLLVCILSQSGPEVRGLLEPLTVALEQACVRGGKVPDALTQPVKRFLQTGWRGPLPLGWAASRA